MFIAYLRRELGGDQPIMNRTLHGKHNNNTAISWLLFETYSWKSTSNTVRVLPVNVVSDWPVMKDAFLGVQSTFTTVFRLPFEGYSWKSKSSTLPRHVT